MKKCPFCGEEIQDVAKKCRFCGEFLEMKKCPFCGEEIPAKASVCSFCNEDLSNESKKSGVLDEKIIVSSNNKLIKIIKDYWILIFLVILVVFLSFRSGNGKNTVEQGDLQLGLPQNQESVDMYYIHSGSKGCEGCIETGFEELEISGITGGYLLSNDFYSCVVKSEDVSKFVESIDKGKFENCDTIKNSELKNTDNMFNLAIVMDNSYSERTGEEGDYDLVNRMKSIKNILNKAGGNIKLSLEFIYSTRATLDEPEITNCDTIYFEIDESEFPVNVVIYKGKKGKLKYYNGYNRLEYQDLSFASFRGTGILCNESEKNKYVCYDVDSMYSQIQSLWETEYNKLGMHEGNPLLECLDNSSLYDNDEIYIITDGQFELTDNQKNLKNISNKYSLQGFPVSNFHYDVYGKIPDKFEKFWSEKIFDLWTGIDCKGKDVYFVGLRKDPPFYNYMVNYYKDKFFTNCNVFEK